MYTLVNFKKGNLLVDGIPVKNYSYFLQWIKGAIKRNNKKEIASRLFSEKENEMIQKAGFEFDIDDLQTNPNLRMIVCPLHYVMDGDYAFVCGFDLWENVSITKCHCGVPNDVHGTCCEWQNAKHILDEGGRIVDSRHPFYNQNFNEYLNRARN